MDNKVISENLKLQSEHLSFLQGECQRHAKKLAARPFIKTFESLLELAELQHTNQLQLLTVLSGQAGGINA